MTYTIFAHDVGGWSRIAEDFHHPLTAYLAARAKYSAWAVVDGAHIYAYGVHPISSAFIPDVQERAAFNRANLERFGRFVQSLKGELSKPVQTALAALPADVLQEVGRVLEEMGRQNRKWGIQDHGAPTWFGIIAEEFGEVAKAMNEGDRDAYCEELIHTAACCVQAAANARRRFKETGGAAANSAPEPADFARL